ncbi:hypothetical protein C8J56DRAFT_896693 [Mycena floridula]|nr:hypothetical protein C8J56DRAFT_896693 [Mycena floridula]
MAAFVAGFLRERDPFQEILHLVPSSNSDGLVAAHTSRRSVAVRKKPFMILKAAYDIDHTSVRRPGQSSTMTEPPHGRVPNITPPCPDVWVTSLKSIATSHNHSPLTVNAGYVVPKPSLLSGVQSTDRQLLYLTNWLTFRTPFIASLMGGTSYALSSEWWRCILYLQRDVNVRTGSKQDSAYQILRHCFENTGLDLALERQNSIIVWRNEERSTDALKNPRLGMEVMFELCELNFRYELQALDNRSRRAPLTELLDLTDARDRLQRCFAVRSDGPLVRVNLSRAHEGLGAQTMQIRAPFMLALKTVMQEWKGAEQMRDLGFERENDISPEIEETVTRFYVQRFYDCFGRVPTLPHYLEPVA